MQQIVFHVPFTEGWFPPDGYPIAWYGVMLLLSFVLTGMIWGPARCLKIGLPKVKTQDLAIVLFLTGIAGARLVYMVQYRDRDFADLTFPQLAAAYFRIDKGGIVLYGGLIGGFLGYLAFHRLVLRKFGISFWKLADAVAPLLALGIAVGRIGCYLNGCCWGQPVCDQCQVVPLGGELGQFPLLPAHAREQVCAPPRPGDRLPAVHGLQTSTGFTIQRGEAFGTGDPRSVVAAVEAGSAAAAAGLQPGDRIVEVNGRPNLIALELTGPAELVDEAVKRTKGGTVLGSRNEGGLPTARIGFDSADAYHLAAAELLVLRTQGLIANARDVLWEQVREWREDRKGQNTISLIVERAGQSVPVAFTPRTVPFYPTQLYETISMFLLIGLLLAFQPFRRHDGQVMVVAILGYAIHRFLNEAIRIEPTYWLGLTLSQWISVGIFTAGVLMEAYLRLTQPKLPPGELPLGYGVEPAKAGV